ncbi:MAG: hypothetical protein JNL38_19195 [Myxococcales bacterium]|jgi:hypothetical protein|nr:hypothetical protein [Myxococcales bacterium]
MRSRIALGLPFVALLASQGVAHSAPRVAIDAPHLKAGQMVELQGGVKISKEQYLKELNQLQEALETDGLSFRKADGRTQTGKLYTHPDAVREHARDKAALSQKVQLLQSHEARGFSHLFVKKGARTFLRGGSNPVAPEPGERAGRPAEDDGERAAPPAAGGAPKGGAPKAGNLTPMPAASASGPGQDDDPLHVTYEESLGSKNRAAIYVGFGMKDTGDPSTIGCDASLDGGVYLFDQKRQLVKLGAMGRIVNKTASGQIDVYLAGKAVDGFPKKGSTTANFNKPIQTPSAGFSYGWGPLSISITGNLASELKLAAQNAQEAQGAAPAGPKAAAPGAAPAHSGKCALSVTPQVRATGNVTAQVSAVLYRAKVKGSIVFLDLSSPASAAVVARPPKMTEDFDAQIASSFLSGEVAIQIDTRIPQNWHDGFDWDKVYSKTLFDWDGLKVNQKLASFRGKTTNL